MIQINTQLLAANTATITPSREMPNALVSSVFESFGFVSWTGVTLITVFESKGSSEMRVMEESLSAGLSLFGLPFRGS